MASLDWDAAGSKFYEAGISRGVLYLTNNEGVAWNGLISVDEKTEDETITPMFMNGAKVMDLTIPGGFAATLTVFTYPDEFLEYDGFQELAPGLFAGNQPPKQFGLSYRTEVGNDIEGLDHGYRIHIVYNITAAPTQVSWTSLGVSSQPQDFAWDLSTVPEAVYGYRATAHAIIDSRRLNSYLLAELEGILYGTDTTPARLPSLAELNSYVLDWELISITLGPDGSVTFTGPEEYFSMINGEAFQITGIVGSYQDANNYTVETTTAKEG